MSVKYVSNFSSGISGEKVEIDPVTSQKASTKFWIRQKPISIDSDHLCACDLVEERSPSEWTTETVALIFTSVHCFTVEATFMTQSLFLLILHTFLLKAHVHFYKRITICDHSLYFRDQDCESCRTLGLLSFQLKSIHCNVLSNS